jgi:hypothetical protein
MVSRTLLTIWSVPTLHNFGGPVRFARESIAPNRESWQRESSRTERLLAAENHAGNVIGLPRGADKFVHEPHQIVQRFLRGAIGQGANGRQPPLIAELLAGRIEGFNATIREKNQRVSRVQAGLAGLVRCIRFDAQR